LPDQEWEFPSVAPPAAGDDVGGEIVHVSTLPGLFTLVETVEQGRPLTELENVSFNTFSPPELLRSAGVPTRIVNEDFSDADIYTGETLRSADAVEYFTRLIERFLRSYTLRVQREWRVSTHVAFTELHCPKRDGTVATFQRALSGSGGSSFELKLLGFKGGDGTSATLKITSALEARNGRCYRVAVPVELLVQECSFKRGISQPFEPFLRMAPLRCGDGFRQSAIPEPCPKCNLPEAQWPKGAVTASYDFKEARGDETALVQLDIEKDRRTKAAMDLQIPGLSTSVEMVGEVITRSGIAYAYKLPGGADYRAYRPPRHPFYYWAVQ
jgi:hypothetical protein